MKGQLPNFFVIGAMKCGTTSLHSYLDQHPDFFMSKVKEIDFFIPSGNFDKGIDWYLEHFITDKSWRGESSQNYSKCHVPAYEGAAQRIFEAVPDANLIYVVRDPIMRLESHYAESVTGEDQDKSLAEFLGYPDNIGKDGFVQTSNYYLQLSEYLKFFSREQIHIVEFDQLISDRLNCMNKIFEFLGASQVNDESLFEFAKNTTRGKQKKSSFGRFVGQSKVSKVIKKSPLAKAARKILNSDLVSQYRYDNFEKISISEEALEAVKEVLEEDTNRFREISGLELNHWSF